MVYFYHWSVILDSIVCFVLFFFFLFVCVNEITKMPIKMLEKKIIINRRKYPNSVATHNLVIRIGNYPEERRKLTVARWNCSGVDCNK